MPRHYTCRGSGAIANWSLKFLPSNVPRRKQCWVRFWAMPAAPLDSVPPSIDSRDCRHCMHSRQSKRFRPIGKYKSRWNCGTGRKIPPSPCEPPNGCATFCRGPDCTRGPLATACMFFTPPKFWTRFGAQCLQLMMSRHHLPQQRSLEATLCLQGDGVWDREQPTSRSTLAARIGTKHWLLRDKQCIICRSHCC
jgi:hypothetical protein